MLNVNDELWKPLEGLEHLYQVSNMGNVSNYRKYLSGQLINSGYLKIGLKYKGKTLNRLVHRLVATAFIDNPDNKREVNHKDGNKLNNIATNLEWVSSAENKKHSKDTGLWVYNSPTKGKKIGKVSIYNNVTFDSKRGKWQSCIRVNKVNMYQRRFDTEEEAALHVNWIIKELHLTDRLTNIID